MDHVTAGSQLQELKPQTQAVYRAIVAYKKSHDGNSPRIRDLMLACKISSTSQTVLRLNQLALAGLIDIKAGARAIEVRGGQWTLS